MSGCAVSETVNNWRSDRRLVGKSFRKFQGFVLLISAEKGVYNPEVNEFTSEDSIVRRPQSALGDGPASWRRVESLLRLPPGHFAGVRICR
jgi:hypothetical protein